MSNEISSLKSFFTSIQVHLSDIWLNSCVNWCKTETLPPNYTLKELQSKVYEQWLLLDLRDVEVPVLPPNISTKQHFTLTGNFCLQMMQIMDISKPKLWQLQKIRNSNALTRGTQQDSEVVGTGKRLLQVTLTDGAQEIEAMEYKPIPCLSLNLPPGSKIRLMGPVVVRRGRLMLEPQNLKILGGEVEELLVSHAAENVLARSLKLPENPNPRPIEEKILAVEKEEKDEGYVTDFKVSKPTQSTCPPKVSEILNITEEDELLMAQELDTPMEAEAQTTRNKTPDLFADDFEDVDFDIDTESTSTQVQSKTKQKQASPTFDDDDDIFNSIDIDAQLDEIVKKVEPNIITISKLIENKNNISKGNFKIKAKFKGIEEKLTIDEGEYKLVIKIEDSSGDLIVRVHSLVVADFAEYSAEEVMNLKNNILGNDTAAKEQMMKILVKVRDCLLKLDNVMVIQIEKDKLPVLTKLV